jgi:hypothetical protein
MKKTQKLLVDDLELDHIFLICDEDKLTLPFFCPICDFVMNTQDDFSSYQRFCCCYECEICFAQSARNKWDKGWRPSDSEINDHKKDIRKKSLNLFCEDGDN